MDFEREFETLPAWLIIAFVMAFVFSIMTALARISGWSELAEHYGGDRIDGARKRFQSMQMGRGGFGMVNFNNVMTLTVTPQTLQLSSFFPFDVAMKPLLIPIADLTATPKRMIFFSAVEFRASRAPSVILRFPAGVSRWIEEQSGARLLAEPLAANAPGESLAKDRLFDDGCPLRIRRFLLRQAPLSS